MAVWINGTLVPDDEARISVFDHGLVTGDGVFETIKVASGVPFALTRHLARLGRSAAGLGLPAPDLDAIRAGAMAAIDASDKLELARMRITVTGGIAPLGSERGGSPVTAIVALGAAKAPAPWVDVVTVPWPRNEHGALSGLKTTSYGENVRALAYANEHGGSEAIFPNTAGELCEGTGSNVFIVSEGRLITPPLSGGCLAGVTRALVIEWAGASEQDVPLSALADADEAFLTGTTRDVQPIRAVDGRVLADAPGPVTRKAAEVFAMRAAESPDP
ncbi:MAG TPA: aminotransferase class IV [Streptosporangiaceae bacterium]|nr:aminotransferase class IV [Streptosporangiaceae bacterium]